MPGEFFYQGDSRKCDCRPPVHNKHPATYNNKDKMDMTALTVLQQLAPSVHPLDQARARAPARGPPRAPHHTPAQPPFLPAGLHLFHEAGRGDIVSPARRL